MGYIREALDSISEEENKKEVDMGLYDDWTQEDEDDNYSSVDHKVCLQEDFPKDIKTFLNKNYDLIYYKDIYRDDPTIFWWDDKNKHNFISDFLNNTKLDIHKTKYKKASKEEIKNISDFPTGTLILKNYKNIPIILFKEVYPNWLGYIAIRKPNNISDYLKEKNTNKNEIYNQLYPLEEEIGEDHTIKKMKDIDVYIPVKAIPYGYKTISNLGYEKNREISKNIEKYLNDEFKIKDNTFGQLVDGGRDEFSYFLGVSALKNAHSSSMKSKLAKWLMSKGFNLPSYEDFIKYFKPKDIKVIDTWAKTKKEISQIVLNIKKELDKLVQDYTQEKDNKVKKRILKEIDKKRKEYSYYLAFTYNSDNSEISDTVGCYYLLKGLIDLIKSFINNPETAFAEDKDIINVNTVEYIRDTTKKTQRSLQNEVDPKDLNQKSSDFYKEVQKSLNSILDQANKLIEELKHSSTDIEYDILERTTDIIDIFEEKVKAINNMKKTILKEELEETSPYTDIKSNGIYSLNTGWVKHPVQQDIPDIDMDEFEKEFKVWEDKYFDLLDEIEDDSKENLTEI